MARFHWNPERRAFRGRSYKKGAVRIAKLRLAAFLASHK